MKMIERTFTISEVGLLTDEKVETVKTWLRRQYFDVEKAAGWRRFSWSDLFSIAVFAEAIGSGANHDSGSYAAGIAPQMVEEIIDNGAAPYLVLAKHDYFDLNAEVVFGADGVGRHLASLIANEKAYGCYVIVDYSSIMLRLFAKLNALNEAK